MLGKKFITFILVLLCLIVSTTQASKSVFIISKHSTPSQAQAYSIDGNEVTLQGTLDVNTYNSGFGAVGNAVWPEKELMFVTYETSPMVVWASTKTLQKVGEFDTGVIALSGIAIDENREKIYIVRRGNNDLYVFSIDEPNNNLVLHSHYELDVPSGYLSAWGIALDETNGLLYISTDTKTVHIYDTNDWGHDHYIDIEVGGTNRPAVGIAVDPTRDYLYTGDWDGHHYLVRTMTNSPYTSIEVEIEDVYGSSAPLLGVDVDEETGLVYCTTYHNDFRVYDSNLSLHDTEPNDIFGPAGVAVGGLYKPPFPLVVLIKDDNDVDCASPLISEAEHEFMGSPYNWLYYNIHYDANGFADTNVIITDHLPAEVNYISSDPCGVYDYNWHTVTWDINDMSASDSNTFRIQVGVNYYAKPGHTIINLCEIESDLYYKFTTLETDVCCYGRDIIYVDANANGFNNGTSWLDAYKDLQDALHTARKCGCEQIWVAEGTYKPTDIAYIYNDTMARSISFELVNNIAIYGGFPNSGDPNFADRDWQTHITTLSGDIAAPNDHSDNSYHVVKCLDVNNAILDGFTITAGNANASGSTDPNRCGGGIYCKDSNNLTLTNCNVSDNSAKYGGGMYNYNEFSPANITNCIFTDNTASESGGGMYNYLSSPKLINCTFTLNKSTIQNSYGGGMYNKQSSPTLINCTFSGNSMGLHGNGGAIYNTSSDPNITNCTFCDNSAYRGGAVYNNYSDPNITNCIFADNETSDCGGGMYSFHGLPEVTNCIFTDNYAVNSGGGIYSSSSEPKITKSIFTGNDAKNNGGGVCSGSSTLNVTNCIFTGNIVTEANSAGAGMHNYAFSSVAVANCVFSGNTSYGKAGGINNNYSGVSLTNCTVSGNAAWYGGGMRNVASSGVNTTNCIFWDNVAGTNGDEILNDSNTCYLSVTYSDVKGGWTGDGNIDEDPCFYEVEQSDGSWTENASYDNSTFQSTLTNSGADWAVNELAGKFVNPYTSQYLQFFIVSNDVNTMKVWSDVNDIAGYGDPYHIYDYHLRVGSACIDHGYPEGDYTGQTDIDGEPRLFDGDANGTPTVDMGADEYYWSPADFNSDGFVNFFDYAFFSSAWQSDPNDENYNEDCDLEDNNSIDYNDIALFCEDWLWQTAWAKAFPFSYGRGMGKSMGMGMGEGFFPSIQAKQAQPELTADDIEEILKWLAELWLTDEEVRKMISEDEWLKFMEAVIQAAKQLIYN